MAQWIENNLKKMMDDIMLDARFQRPLPTEITLHGVAYKKFIEILQSKSAFFPDATGSFNFIGVPVHLNSSLPYGCFVVSRHKKVPMINKPISVN